MFDYSKGYQKCNDIICFLCWRFHVLFYPLFKVLFNFPSRYLFTIGLVLIFSFRWNLPPTLGCNPKQPDSLIFLFKSKNYRSFIDNTSLFYGTFTLFGAPFLETLNNLQSFWRSVFTKTVISWDYNSCSRFSRNDSVFELFPVHSPLLGES